MKAHMKATGFAVLLVSLSLCAASVHARDVVHFLPIKDVLEQGKSQGLDGDIKFYFGGQRHPAVVQTFAKGITTNKKTNSANKSDEAACNIAMLSALIQMQKAARDRGANAVVNIESFYDRKPFRSDDQFKCAAGRIMNGVALRGDIVNLKR